MSGQRLRREHVAHFDSEDHLRHTIAALLTRIPNHRNVQITHGLLEKGKDIIFAVPGPFGSLQYSACVVKNTPITADHNSKHRLSVVLEQVRQAFKSPFLDSNAREVYVSRCFIVCPHQVSQTTLVIIKDELAEFRSTLEIIDGPQLFTLLQQYYPLYKSDDFSASSIHLQQLREDVRTDKPLQRVAFSSLQAEANRDAHLVYVRPTFEAVIRLWQIASTEHLVPATIQTANEKSARFPRCLLPLASLPGVSRLKTTCRNQLAIFVAEHILEESSLSTLLATYDALYETVSTLAGVTKPDDPPSARNATSYRSTVRSVPIGAQDKDRIVQLTDSIKFALDNAASTVNKGLAAIAEIAKPIIGTVGFLDNPHFCRAQLFSDESSFQPGSSITCLWTERSYIEGESFHGSARSAFIVAPAGYGKTSFCRWHTLEDDKLLSTDAHDWLAVYIQLHKLSAEDLIDLSASINGHADLTLQAFGRSQRAGKVRYRIYLDGLDEIPDESSRALVLDLVRKKGQLRRPTTYILTARDHLIGTGTTGIPRVSIRPFVEDQIESLASLWIKDPDRTKAFMCQLRASTALFELARIPLLSTLIILIYQKTWSLPQSRLALYESFIELLCSGWNLAKGLQRRSSYSAAFKQLVLRQLALDTHLRRRKAFSVNDISRIVAGLNVHFSAEDLRAFTDEVSSDGILQQAASLFEFQHLSFQEYLAATALMSSPSRDPVEACLVRYLRGDNWWRDVLEFYVLLIRNPQDAIRWIDRHIKLEDEPGSHGFYVSNADHLKEIAQRAFVPM